METIFLLFFAVAVERKSKTYIWQPCQKCTLITSLFLFLLSPPPLPPSLLFKDACLWLKMVLIQDFFHQVSRALSLLQITQILAQVLFCKTDTFACNVLATTKFDFCTLLQHGSVCSLWGSG